MDKYGSYGGVTRRQFINGCGAAAGYAALVGLPISTLGQNSPTAAEPLEGVVAAWVRRRPGGVGRIILCHRPPGAEAFQPLGVVSVCVGASPAGLTAEAHAAVVDRVAQSWNVPASTCRLADGAVTHDGSRRRVGVCVWLSLEDA